VGAVLGIVLVHCSLSPFAFTFPILSTVGDTQVVSCVFGCVDTICLRISGDDAGGRDTFAAVGATVCEFCRNPARNHDVYRCVESSISTVTVSIGLTLPFEYTTLHMASSTVLCYDAIHFATIIV
jgi:hypothetical protein